MARPTITVDPDATLSDAEAANAGTHSYSFTATFTEGCSGETSGSHTLTVEFVGNRASLSNTGNRSEFFKVADNTYEGVDPFGEAVVMEFTENGIHAYSWCADWVYTRN